MVNISQTDVWRALVDNSKQGSGQSMSAMFAADPERFNKYSLKAGGIFLDYSKNLCTDKTWQQLFKLLQAVNFSQKRADMFAGLPINTTENRPAWHTALRARDKMPQVQAVLEQMQLIVDRLWHQLWLGFSGKPITDVVNIGIGGSDFGPLMACRALKQQGPLRCHFISNLDQAPLADLQRKLNPETTLFVVISKSFTTKETLTNAKNSRQWLLDNGCLAKDLRQHFLAITAKPELAIEFGVHVNDILPMWGWVGGRFSMWSAVGLCIAIHAGMQNFLALLDGASAMDQHFLEADVRQNMPVILGLLALWYQNFLQADTQAVIPYMQALEYLPNYLQQAHMESLGKQVNYAGEKISYQTGQIIWGSTGTNSQHAYHQLLMQGKKLIPVDFVLERDANQPELFANCLAQAEVLMSGFQSDDPHKTIPGNQPSNLLVLDKLDAKTLGELIALYEHKIFVQSAVWQINAFDQWGVERGKKMAAQICQRMFSDDSVVEFDASTQGLIAYYLQKEKANV